MGQLRNSHWSATCHSSPVNNNNNISTTDNTNLLHCFWLATDTFMDLATWQMMAIISVFTGTATDD